MYHSIQTTKPEPLMYIRRALRRPLSPLSSLKSISTNFPAKADMITYVERQPVVVRRERDLRPLGEIKHISGGGSDLLARFIRDFELALEDDLHLVVGVGVDERGAFFQSVEATRDRLFGVVFLAGRMLANVRSC